MSRYPPGEWIRPDAPYDKRQSSQSSNFSHGSFHKAEIGEAVPVPIKRSSSVRTQGSVKYYEGSIKRSESATNTDEESMFSENQVQLGRLDTRLSKAPRGEGPLMTLRTDVEDVVPPRLKRRPVSEILSSNRSSSPKHAHRFSANITDDLDRLMENAHSLRSEPMHDEEEIAPLASPQESHYNAREAIAAEEYEAKRLSTFSSQSFETAESGEGSQYSPPVPPHTVTSPASRTLPKRPSPQSMEKARVASQQFSLYSKEEDRTLSLHEVEADTKAAYEAGKPEPQDPENPQKPEVHTAADYYFKAYEREFAAEQGFTPDTATTSEAATSVVPSRNTSVRGPTAPQFEERGVSESKEAETNLPTASEQEGSTNANLEPPLETAPEEAPVEAAPSESADRGDLDETQIQEIEEVQPVEEPVESYLEQPQPNTLLARSDPNIAAQRDSLYMDQMQGLQGGDDEYYDIEEPMVVSNPARAKSVKDNIQMPKRKSTKRKSRKSVRSGSRGTHLKPFSYNTLVHLLESINGAVIGEEFETLNIPIKEKQLIEKIVDSLSRLTSDMLLDELRCEVGLERLEKAHKALEGFL